MKKRHFNIFIVILLAILGYFIYIAINQQIYINNIAEQRETLQKRYNDEKDKNKELTAEKNALQDPSYIEKIAREELGMTKKGEIPYVSSDKE